jgi:channel protein (hemolysin III family)
MSQAHADESGRPRRHHAQKSCKTPKKTVHGRSGLLPLSDLSGPSLIRAIPGFFEPIASLSHLAAAAVGLIASVPMLRLGRGGRMRLLSVAIYTFAVVASLAVSGAYHSLEMGRTRTIMQRLDYSMIWLLIAGTFTAIHGVLHEGRWRTWMLAFVWTYSAIGCLAQVVRFDLFSGFGCLVVYLGLAWAGLLSIVKLARQLGFKAIWPVCGAGLVYTVGAVAETLKQPTLVAGSIGPHEVFHLAVILGACLNWSFIHRVLTVHAPSPLLVPAPAPMTVIDGRRTISA